MGEPQTTTESLFSEPGFQLHFKEWRQAHTVLCAHNSDFRNAVRDELLGPDGNREDPFDNLSYICETSIDQFEGIYHYNTVSQKVRDVHGLRVTAKEELARAKSELLKYSKRIDANQFVLFALNSFLHPNVEDTSKQLIEGEVKSAEENLLDLDELVQNNPGEALTIVNRGWSMQSGRLGSGALTIEESRLYLPIAEGQHAYELAISPDINEVFTPSKLIVNPNPLLMSPPNIMSQSEALNVSDWWPSRLSCFVGEIAQGPPYIGEDTRDRDFLTGVFKRMCKITQLAINSGN